MAEIDARVQSYNSDLIKLRKQPDIIIPDDSLIINLLKRKSAILERILSKKGLEVCHYADIHSFDAPPEDWELSYQAWKLGLFPKENGRLFFRTEATGTYGRNPDIKLLNPELIILCPEHYPKYGIKSVTKQGPRDWHKSMISSVVTINGALRPMGDLSIIIDQSIKRNRPESVYQYFGFLPSLPNLTV